MFLGLKRLKLIRSGLVMMMMVVLGRILLEHFCCGLASQRVQTLGFWDWLAIEDAARRLLLIENGEVRWRLTQTDSVQKRLNHEAPLIIEPQSLLTVVVLRIVHFFTNKSLALGNNSRFNF